MALRWVGLVDQLQGRGGALEVELEAQRQRLRLPDSSTCHCRQGCNKTKGLVGYSDGRLHWENSVLSLGAGPSRGFDVRRSCGVCSPTPVPLVAQGRL
jgi:hypothetical protein